MIFASPSWFYLFLLLPFLVVYHYRKRNESGIFFSSISFFQGASKTLRQRFLFIPPLLFYLALSVFICGLARPQKSVIHQRKDREGVAIEMLLDVSTSMDIGIRYGDRDESRMEVAKKVVEDFVVGNGNDLGGRVDDLVGVVTFARYADTVCPMTLSHGALINIVRDLKINDRPNEDGTAYGDATVLAAARLKSLESGDRGGGVCSKIIVLLTDGENNCGKHLPLQAAGLAKKWGIRIYTISIQERPEVKELRLKEGFFLSPAGSYTSSDKVLYEMAEMTGGVFRTAYDFDSLQAVYSQIDSLEKSKIKSVNYIDKEELFLWFAFAGIILLLVQNFLTATIFRIGN